MASVSLGLEVGGQAYQVLLVFDDKTTLERFKEDRLEFSADVSGVVLKDAFDAHVRYIEGVAIFSRTVGGLMGGSALGGRAIHLRSPGRQRDLSAGQPVEALRVLTEDLAAG